MHLLDKIMATKTLEVARRKKLYPTTELEKSVYFHRPIVSMSEAIRRCSSPGIIAEFKRLSPSKGTINTSATVERVTTGYFEAGAAGVSVLTDTTYFGGTNEDLKAARWVNAGPVLRKDFILDEYQVLEARAIGADVILLIAECLSREQTRALASLARSLELEVLLEVHSREQLEKWTPDIHLIGVNNRNLKDFSVDLQTSFSLLDALPREAVRVSESGLNVVSDVGSLYQAGYQGFLIGEHFMRAASPAKNCRAFIESVIEQTKDQPYAKV